jgi:hypothetical protein
MNRIEEPIFGDMKWLVGLTGWTHDKIARLARRRLIPGAFKAQPGLRGDHWTFRKTKVLAWLNGLEVGR